MKNQNTLYLVSNNQTLKKYYIPLTSIKVDLYPVMAKSFQEAIYLANLGPTDTKGSVKKTFILDEYHTNEAYESLDISLNELFSRQIDHYDIEIETPGFSRKDLAKAFKKNIDAGFDRLGIDKSTLPKNHFESIESLMEVEAEAEEEARRLSKKYNLVNKIKKISKLQKKKNKNNKKKED